MPLPQANLVLFFLSGFVALWGVSVVLRGLSGSRDTASRRCPQCRTDMLGLTGRRCPECAFEAASERDLHRRRPDRRVVAVGALATAVGGVLIPVGISVRSWETTGYADNTDLHPLNALFAGVTAFAVVLLVWAVRGDRAKGRRRCPECWYDMRGTLPTAAVATDAADYRDQARAPNLLCPECGHTATTDRDLYKPRRRPRLALLAVAIVLLSFYGQTVPRALRTGPLGLVPTTVLIGGMRWLPEAWYVDTNRANRATLQARVWDDDVWGWQRAWGRAAALRSLESGRFVQHPSAAASMLDVQQIDDRERAIRATLRLLNDPDRAAATDDATALLEAMGSLLWLPGRDVESTRAEEIRGMVAAAEPMLSERVRKGTEADATIAIQLFWMVDPRDADWVPAVAERAVHGGKPTAWMAVQLLAGEAAADPRALGAIEAALSSGTSQKAARFGLHQFQINAHGDQELAPFLALVRSSTDPGVVRGAAEAFVGVSSDAEPYADLIRAARLPDAVRAGFAESRSLGVYLEIGDAIELVLPAAANADPEIRDRVLWFLKEHPEHLAPHRDEILPVVSPLAKDEDKLTAQMAAEIMAALDAAAND